MSNPLVNIILGILSVPLILLIFYFYSSFGLLISLLIGVLIGILVNILWFSFMEDNFKLFIKLLLDHRKHFAEFCRKGLPNIILYILIFPITITDLYVFGILAPICMILGVCLTGLLFYSQQEKFYTKLLKEINKNKSKPRNYKD